MALLQELVRVFNFHRYDNLKHASDKKDPRRQKYETRGLSIVNLLFSAASGDVTAMRRSAGTARTLKHNTGQDSHDHLHLGGRDDTLIDFVDKIVTTLFCMK